jgi:sterol desaturase/sphingolipid hydroxylase (fatty acid hydroxylase superfamily)
MQQDMGLGLRYINMQNLIAGMLKDWAEFACYAVYFFTIFSFLAIITPCNKNQPIIHKGMITDILYRLIIPVFSQFVSIVFLSTGFGIIYYNTPPEQLQEYIINGHGYLATMPLWLQAATVFFLSDVLLYWTHRFFHTPKLWKWHAIHHSSKIVDWLSTYRFHPVNAWLSFTLVNVLMLLLGFSPNSIAVMGSFNMAYSYMVHANLNWTFGPFRYLFASPVFHRWHHTTQKEGLNKNFAPTFPFLDVMFGTFYMPEGKLPEHYGIDGVDMPESFLKQLIWPFKQ